MTRVLSREACAALAARIFDSLGGLPAQVRCHELVRTATQVIRGRTEMVSEQSDRGVALQTATKQGRWVLASTTRLDNTGLDQLVRNALASVLHHRTPSVVMSPDHAVTYPAPPQLWFDHTLLATEPATRGAVLAAAQEATARTGLVAAADLAAELDSYAVVTTAGRFAYVERTYAEFSMTARTSNGKGSGWAWSGFEDWGRVETAPVIAKAVDLAQRSANPVAVEPGRYTVILEPSAVAAFVGVMLDWGAFEADEGMTAYARDPVGNNKIGLQMLDRRLQMVADPWDPDKPTSVFDGQGNPIPAKVVWFEDGVLRNLAYSAGYAQDRGKLRVVDPGGARLYGVGATTSLEDMIKSVKRGLWVNRLSHLNRMNRRTGLTTGTTRDGIFLIENGKITKAVKNFRFTESPFFVFNKLDAFGEPVRASRAIVCPRLMVRDFDFTSLTDAV